jgi:CHRD domain
MSRTRSLFVSAAAAFCALAAGGAAQAQSSASAKLSGYEEVPALNSSGSGSFRGTINANSIAYTLRYKGLATDVAQAHIHFGQKGVNGGVSVLLCSNTAGGGTPVCPAGNATVTGTLKSADVLGPTAQNIAAGDFDALVSAMRAGLTYANVHTAQFPNGEIRGQVKVKN